MMAEDIVRVTCVHEGCGTFPMDRATCDHLKRTGKPFTCPGGHKQHFTESVEQKLRTRIDELEREVERLESRAENQWDYIDDLREERDEQRDRAKLFRRALLADVDGVIQVGEDCWLWGCQCGGQARSTFESESDAEQARRQHDRQSCSLTENGGQADV